MERKFEFATDEFYHVYNRGADKREIFLSDADKQRFMKLLYACNGDKPVVMARAVKNASLSQIDRGESIIDIGAYCLMPNHFHILVKEKIDGGLSRFMLKLSTAYSMYFNKIHERSGVLFEGKFKARHVDRDEYLNYLFAYIHLNPVKLMDPQWKENGIGDRVAGKKYLTSYSYSSYLDFIGVKRDHALILNRAVFPEYFMTEKDFQDFIDFWLSNKEED